MNTLRSTTELLGLVSEVPADPVNRIDFTRQPQFDRPLFRERERAFLRDFATSFGVSRGAALNVKDAPFYALGDGNANDTAAIQAALDLAGTVGFGVVDILDGTFKVTGSLTPSSKTLVRMSAKTVILQTTPNTTTFSVVQKDNVHFFTFGGVTYGEGGWSAAWNDFASHLDRGYEFDGCTNCSLNDAFIRNQAMCGWVIRGGTNVKIRRTIVEGTHALGHPLTAVTSLYQFGGIIMHDATYGSCVDVEASDCEIFNTAIGVNTVDNTTPGTSFDPIRLPDLYCHDIIGQHGAYIGTASTHLPAYRAARCGLIGFKFFSGSQNEIITESTCIGFVVTDCGGEASQFGVSGTGYVANCHAIGYARNVTRLHVCDGDVRNCTAIVKGRDITNRALYVAKSLTANGPVDNTWDIDCFNVSEKAALISAVGSDRNVLRMKARKVSVGGGGHWGVGYNSGSGLTIEKLDVSDDTGNMTFAFYAEANGSGAKFACTPNAQGYTTNAFRSDNATSQVRWEAPSMDVTSVQTAFFGQGNNFEPVTPMFVGRQTTVLANVPLWQETADDESVYTVTAEIVGKLAGSAERRGALYQATFWRDAAGVLTQQGATSVLHDVQSAGFGGTVSFLSTVNDMRIVVSSPGASTYDWRAKVSVLKMSP